MKKFTLSVIAVMSIGTFAIAGGNIKNVEPAVEPVAEVFVPDESNFYVGLGYSYMALEIDFNDPRDTKVDITGNAYTLLAGYNFNKYIAVEGRYSATVGDLSFEVNGGSEEDVDGKISNIALYLKPMYPVGGVTLYGLLGYGKVTLDNGYDKDSENSFQWGLGASYAVNDDIGVFVDYTRLYDDKNFAGWGDDQTDVLLDSINVGVTYKF